MNIDPFWLLPPERDWKNLAKTIKNPKDISTYVSFYMAPLKEIQLAERNSTMHLDVIQKCVLKALELSIRAVNELKLTRKEWEGKLLEDFRAATRRSLTMFEGSEAAKMRPILKVKTMRRFILQRLDDMLYGTRTYAHFESEKRRFVRMAKRIYRNIAKTDLYHMRHVVRKTADLSEEESNLVRDIRKFHREKETAIGRSFKKHVWKVKHMGDDASQYGPGIMTFIGLLCAFALSL